MAGAWLRRCVIALIAVCGPAAPVAHAAESHGPVAQAIVMAPRAEARLGNQEVVITYVDRSLIVYLQRYVDGVPTTGAEIELVVDFLPSYPEEVAPGIYLARDVSLAGSRNQIELALTVDGRTESAVLPLAIPSGVASPAGLAARPAGAVPAIAFAIAAAAVYLVVSLLLLRRTSSKSPELGPARTTRFRFGRRGVFDATISEIGGDMHVHGTKA